MNSLTRLWMGPDDYSGANTTPGAGDYSMHLSFRFSSLIFINFLTWRSIPCLRLLHMAINIGKTVKHEHEEQEENQKKIACFILHISSLSLALFYPRGSEDAGMLVGNVDKRFLCPFYDQDKGKFSCSPKQVGRPSQRLSKEGRRKFNRVSDTRKKGNQAEFLWGEIASAQCVKGELMASYL